MATLALILASFLWYEISTAIPIRRFYKQFNWVPNNDGMMGLMVKWAPNPPTYPTWHAVELTYPLESDPNKIVAMCYTPQPRAGQPAMQIALKWAFIPASGIPSQAGGWTLGSPPILCNLNDDQAEFVIAHGIPQAIIDEMIDESVRQGWPATTPFAPTPSPLGSYSQDEIVVVPVDAMFDHSVGD